MDTKNFGLNKAQLEAVKAPLGPVLILAGAGSGKTRALAMRIVYLLNRLKFPAHSILAVTFTNKAAGEMKERVRNFLGKRAQLPMMGTFHSIGAKILREDGQRLGLGPNFVIFDEDDQESLLKEILIELKIDPTKFKPSLFAHLIDQAKNNLVLPRDYDDAAPILSGRASPIYDGRDRFNRMTKQVYEHYEDHLRKNNAVDFGDLIMLPVKLFREYPKVLQKYQQRWQYLLVDEYQDTNHAQYEFSKLLASLHRNIFVVGDDAQAIYGFRGANLQNILDFEKDYPETKGIRLEQNYRSTSQILSIAEKVIALNSEQHQKKLWTENHEGQAPTLYQAEDEMAEAWFVAKTIIDLQDNPPLSPLILRGDETAKGPPLRIRGGEGELEYEPEEEYDDGILSRIMRTKSYSRILPKLKNREGLSNIAVLYRTHAQSRALEEVMIESSIPYQIVGGLKFYERKEIKDMLAYLRLLINPEDLISLKRVINVPPRGIGKSSFDLIKQKLMKNPIARTSSERSESRGTKQSNKKIDRHVQSFDWTRDGFKPQIQDFFSLLETLSGMPDDANLLDVLRSVLKLTGYEAFLKDGSEEGEARWENVQELFNVAGSFSKLPWQEGLTQFLEEVALLTGTDELDANAQKVTLMTLHQAKGLEFETVFLIGLEEGLLPHARSIMDPASVAEEVRLAYVGITRAKKNLYLIYCASRKQFGSRNLSVPSRILKAIPEELLEIYDL